MRAPRQSLAGSERRHDLCPCAFIVALAHSTGTVWLIGGWKFEMAAEYIATSSLIANEMAWAFFQTGRNLSQAFGVSLPDNCQLKKA
jgi:hypothetical protein